MKPLIIYGKSGIGKTHFSLRLHRIYVLKNKYSLFLTANDLIQVWIFEFNMSSELLIKYLQSFELIIIDDMDFLEDKKTTLKCLKTVFLRVLEIGSIIIVILPKSPKFFKNIYSNLINND